MLAVDFRVCSRAGVGNSFGFAGHIRDKSGIPGQDMSLQTGFDVVSTIKQFFFWMFNVFL